MTTSTDPEPAVGTVVRDEYGALWERRSYGRRCWFMVDEDDGSIANADPESWVRVAGNYGPVKVIDPPTT